jgi:hypothetical protein
MAKNNRLPDDKANEDAAIVHFCFGMTADFGGRPFGLSHYLAVRSAWEVIRPKKMVLHCRHVPAGKWWEQAKPLLGVHVVPEIKGIYGFPASHPAHRADIVRLAALLTVGGIYLDLDVVVVKPFDGLLTKGFAASLELAPTGCPVGLCNAILLAERGSVFGQLCLEGHDPSRSLWDGFRSTGRDEHYVEYSVRYPALLADLCPGMVDRLSPETFLWVRWNEEGLKEFFEKDIPVPASVRCIHLWESHSWERYLKPLTEQSIKANDTTYHRLVRPFLPELPLRYEASTDFSQTINFEPMDRVCRESSFVASIHSNKKGLAASAKKKLAAFRDHWFVPLRSRLDRVEAQIDSIADQLDCTRSETTPKARLGIIDRSSEIQLPPLSGATKPAVFVSGDRWVPEGLLQAVNSAPAGSVWIITDLVSATEQRERHLQQRHPVRVVHSPPKANELRNTLSATLYGKPLSILAFWDLGCEYCVWEALSDLAAERVITTANPLLPASEALVVRPGQVNHPSGVFWGASVRAFELLAQKSDLRLHVATSDSGFLLFCRDCDENKRVLRKADVEICLPVNTSYSQTIQLPISIIREMLKDEVVENIESGQLLRLRDCDGFPWTSCHMLESPDL